MAEMEFEDRYLDVLQNLEQAIVSVYREDTSLADSNVLRALDNVIEHYTAEKLDRAPKSRPLNEIETHVAYRMKAVCEWRMQRNPLTEPGMEHIADRERQKQASDFAKTSDEILQCLKRLHKAAQKWNKRGGRRGYLDFISRFT